MDINETTPIDQQIIQENDDENEMINHYENINKIDQQPQKEEEEEINKKKNELLSSCSFSSSSSSSYETPLCVNTNGSINITKNSSDLFLPDEGL